MSIALMTLAWKSSLPAGRKMVLLALCDNANDQGECFPSVPMLAEKCSMGERTVQQHIADMEAAGIVTREMRTGRSTIYRIDPRKFCTPAEDAPPQNPHPTPAESAPPPPQISHHTPADSAPITINEPSIEPSGNRQAPAAQLPVFALPDWVPVKAWEGYLAMRKKKRAVPTDHARDLVIAELAKLRAEGQSVEDVLNQSTRNSWTDVYPVKGAKAKPAQTAGPAQLGKAGQATAANAQRLLEQWRKENGQAG